MIRTNILFIEFLEKTSAIHLLPILQELSKNKNYNVTLLGQKGSFLSRAAKNSGIRIYTINYIELNIHKPHTYLPFLKTLLLIYKIIRKHNISLIHCHRLDWAYLGILAAKIFHLPVLVDIPFIFKEKLPSKIQNYIISHHEETVYLAISEHVKQIFHQLYGISFNKIIVFYGGINMHKIARKKPDNIIFNKIKNKKIVAMISRLAPSKGVDVFIEAAGILKEKWKNAYFIFIGYQKNIDWGHHIWQESYVEDCKKRIKNLNLENQFSIIDFDYSIFNWYPFFYCTALPTQLEPLGYVAIESQLYKKPVIITDVGGAPETVNYGKAGILIPHPPSPFLLAKAIDSFLTNKKKYQYYSEQGYLWVKKQFDISKNIKKLIEIYQNITHI